MLHLVKLCVGAKSPEALESYIAAQTGGRKDLPVSIVTRMMPKRVDELLDGGSLYWVMKGKIQARQKLLGLDSFKDAEGIGRCALILDQEVVRTSWAPRSAFQGWRYLEAETAPRDAEHGQGDELPPHLQAELSKLGLL